MRPNHNRMLAALAGGFHLATFGPAAPGSMHSQRETATAKLQRKLAWFVAEYKRQRSIRKAQVHLAQLDDHLLRDIGVARHQILTVVSDGRIRD
jgi:uncharacterized protein YjiS (DUF1127 family)